MPGTLRSPYVSRPPGHSLDYPTSEQQKRVLNLFRYEVNLPLPQHVWSVLVLDERNQDGFLLVPKRMTSPCPGSQAKNATLRTIRSSNKVPKSVSRGSWLLIKR